MLKQKQSFAYFFAWLIAGAFLGVVILLISGDIHLITNQPANPTAAENNAPGRQSFQRVF